MKNTQRRKLPKNGGRRKKGNRTFSPGAGRISNSSLGTTFPTSQRRWFSYTNLVVVNNAGVVGANTTIPLYLPSTLSPAPVGFSAYYSPGATGGLYLSNRVIALRVKASFQNQEAFGVRVATVLTVLDPANNTLQSLATQGPYISPTGSVVRFETIGPLTGNGRTDLTSYASTKRTLGVSHVRGLVDPYTTYWDSATGAAVTAVSGLNLIILVLSAVNLVAGVLVSLEVDLEAEFFNINPTKTT